MPAVRRNTDGMRWIFFLYLGLIVWAPLPLGSNRPWSWAVLALWVFALALGWLAGRIRGRYPYPAIFRDARPVLWCAALWLIYVWLQLLPLPIGLLELVSPEAARWHLAAAAPQSLAAAPLTLDRYATLEAACKSTAYIAFFALSLALLCERARIRQAAYALIASGVLQALYGALYRFQNLEHVAAGTFANRDHYATYLVMCLSVGIGVLIATLSGARYRSWVLFFRDAIQWMITPKMALRLGLVVMVIALVLSRSRMGNISFFASLMGAGAIGLLLAKRATRSMVILLASLVAVDVFLVGTYFGTQRVIERIAQTDMQTEDRGEVAVWTLNMWKDYPVFGSGLGSFPVVYPRYAGQKAYWTYTHAHNDYLEFGAETGAVGLALLASIVLLSLAAALRAQYLRRDPLMRGLSFAAIMGIGSLLVHSFVDFSLQIPANALTFMLLLAFAWISLRYTDAES